MSMNKKVICNLLSFMKKRYLFVFAGMATAGASTALLALTTEEKGEVKSYRFDIEKNFSTSDYLKAPAWAPLSYQKNEEYVSPCGYVPRSYLDDMVYLPEDVMAYRTRSYSNGAHYRGFMKDGVREGELGLYHHPDGSLEFGRWKDGKCLNKHSFPVEEHIYGIDVSHYQQDVLDWDRFSFRCDGVGNVTGKKIRFHYNVLPVHFSMIKATEGADMQDAYFHDFFTEAGRHRMIRGAYHVLSVYSEVKDQVENYLSTVGTFESEDFPPILDIEAYPKRNCQLLAKLGLEWLREVEQRTGVKPMIYTSAKFYRTFMMDGNGNVKDEFKGYPVWIALYNLNRVPNDIPWTMWQFTESGYVNGVSNGKLIDINKFNGSYKELQQFVKNSGFKGKWEYSQQV